MTVPIGEYTVRHDTKFLYHGLNPRMPPGYARYPAGHGVPASITGNTTFSFLGPQAFILAIRNINVLGAPLTIEHQQMRDTYGQIIFPQHTLLTHWSFFAHEPYRWNFRISTEGNIVCTLEAWVRESFLAQMG